MGIHSKAHMRDLIQITLFFPLGFTNGLKPDAHVLNPTQMNCPLRFTLFINQVSLYLSDFIRLTELSSSMSTSEFTILRASQA